MRAWLRLGLWLLALSLPVLAYSYPELGLTFKDPAGWKSTRSDTEVRWEPPANDPQGWAMFSVRTAEVGETSGLSREQILETTRVLASSLQNFKLAGTKPIKVAGLPGHLLSYSATSGKVSLHTTQVFVVRSGQVVIFTMTSPPAGHAARRKILDAILASVHWGEQR